MFNSLWAMEGLAVVKHLDWGATPVFKLNPGGSRDEFAERGIVRQQTIDQVVILSARNELKRRCAIDRSDDRYFVP